MLSAVQTIANELRGDKTESICSSLCFLRDLALSKWIPKKNKTALMKLIESNGVYRLLNKGLYSNDESIRADCIYTIGKLTNKKYFKYLSRAFYALYSNAYPLEINSIFFEATWLSRRDVKKMVKHLVASDSFLFRWSALSLDNCLDFEMTSIRKLFAPLEFDLAPEIRAEYVYKFCHSKPENLIIFDEVSCLVRNISNLSKMKFEGISLLESAFHYCASNHLSIKSRIIESRRSKKDESVVWLEFAKEIQTHFNNNEKCA